MGCLPDRVNPSTGVKFSHVNLSSWGNRFVLHQFHGKSLWRKLYSLFKDPLFSVRRLSSARNKFKNSGGFIDRQRTGVGVGEEENRRSLFFFLALRTRQFFEKRKRKTNKVCVQARGFTPLEVKATLLKSYRKSSESEEEER